MSTSHDVPPVPIGPRMIAARAALQVRFPSSVVRPRSNKDRWVVLAWSGMTCRWDNFGAITTLAKAKRYCAGKFSRDGSPIRLVRVDKDGRIARVVDGFTGRPILPAPKPDEALS